MVTVHEPTPLHAPDQPANVDESDGRALSVTTSPAFDDATQLVGQLIRPSGAVLATLPAPVPLVVTDRLYCTAANVAVIVVALMIPAGKLQVSCVPHGALQPTKVMFASGVATSVTGVAMGRYIVHTMPQSMPGGSAVTRPVPVALPVTNTFTVSGKPVVDWNCTPTVALVAPATNEQVGLLPEAAQAPVHWASAFCGSGDAVSVTVLPIATLLVQGVVAVVQLKVPATEPLPKIWSCTCDVADGRKFAVTFSACVVITVHVGVLPLHAPAQPLNVDPAVGVAVSVTLVLLSNA